jgi:predicted Fe-Mo cluster-binding NifX family protein
MYPNQDHKDAAQTKLQTKVQPAVKLEAEEVEAVIAPRLGANHNENLLRAGLNAEEIEAVIAPKLAANHNESLLMASLCAEEIEAVIAPKLSANHNETFLQ